LDVKEADWLKGWISGASQERRKKVS